ncbi:hypothetical protein GCM10009789_30990 [Kribbella sancticallisti]|uniref:Uncharacterized protein n=1 Tax=Kribbella sancticallisti TaxID=460087 RepID=A0ABN2DDE6_9ACTN
MGDDRLVPRDSAVYQEFARLYQLVRDMRPTSVDRWNRNLYATDSNRWGGFDPKTGDIRLSQDRALRHLTGPPSASHPDDQAEALATVLHESTHAGMATDAPAEPNAVRSAHSQGAMEGFAELRAMNDFAAFSANAGYPGLTLPTPAYPGAYAAMNSLVTQASGPAKDRYAFIAEATHGPGVMHFDQLADGVVRNRLAEVVPDGDRVAVRAALIEAMKHEHWPTLPERSAGTGEAVAEDIRRSLNAKVEEIRRHYRATPGQPFPAESPNAEVARSGGPRGGLGAAAEVDGHVPGAAEAERQAPAAAEAERQAPAAVAERQVAEVAGVRGEMRFLSGLAPAGQATWRVPSLGDGARGAGASVGGGAGRSWPGRTSTVDRGRE